MLSTWTRSISPQLQNFNRYNTAGGLMCKFSRTMPMERISQCSVHVMRPKRSDVVAKNNKILFGHYPTLSVRAFSDKSPSSIPPPPNPPSLPNREQVERAFFRVVAFLWDYGLWLFAWSHRMVKLHVVEKPLVKFYWKRFHQKMEEAKKEP